MLRCDLFIFRRLSACSSEVKMVAFDLFFFVLLFGPTVDTPSISVHVLVLLLNACSYVAFKYCDGDSLLVILCSIALEKT